ncbi:uncharacterized protein MONBRDRAFT_38941 [Monosiga brevicollis MX1]|uniref:Uncharacterized protein n=1 Tax=Monosiga brevicollis TaxID=81824 RepID=A9VB32_MONBE|nr:uncharacterized protein MONBRDRAFT_38941 [Monosiga brevicollis MX1]EDQ85321.1 predicted protein [Monosiga brevicollis MX1]|eukprot:XP_001749942.1 hypothetical protein [Monosiga brevicollis MX1]
MGLCTWTYKGLTLTDYMRIGLYLLILLLASIAAGTIATSSRLTNDLSNGAFDCLLSVRQGSSDNRESPCEYVEFCGVTSALIAALAVAYIIYMIFFTHEWTVPQTLRIEFGIICIMLIFTLCGSATASYNYSQYCKSISRGNDVDCIDAVDIATGGDKKSIRAARNARTAVETTWVYTVCFIILAVTIALEYFWLKRHNKTGDSYQEGDSADPIDSTEAEA